MAEKLDRLQEIILDYQEVVLFTGTARRLGLQQMPGKAAVCIGVRRSGKSTYLHQIVNGLLQEGIDRKNILYINFFDDRLHHLLHEGPAVLLDAYFSLYPEKKNKETVYCFFDEIQSVSNWEAFVDRILRTENAKVYITGSSASMLSKEIATQLRGRSISWEMFPFSFREYLDHKGVPESPALSSSQRMLAQKAFNDYWEEGGFPEVAGISRQLRIKVHQEYFNIMVFRDLVERHNIAHPRAVADLAHWLVDNTGSMYSINSLFGYISSLGHKAPKAAVADYLDWFEDAYVFFTVRLFDASVSRSKANPKKIYCVDHSMVRSVGSGILVNSGHLLENLVFLGLRRLTPKIFYYKTGRDKEVDFIAIMPDGNPKLVQVCETLADQQTYNREVNALTEAMTELGIREGIIATRWDEREIQQDTGTVRVIPAWRFLLELQRLSV